MMNGRILRHAVHERHGPHARGISEEDIAKVLGGNLLRVYKANWR